MQKKSPFSAPSARPRKSIHTGCAVSLPPSETLYRHYTNATTLTHRFEYTNIITLWSQFVNRNYKKIINKEEADDSSLNYLSLWGILTLSITTEPITSTIPMIAGTPTVSLKAIKPITVAATSSMVDMIEAFEALVNLRPTV